MNPESIGNAIPASASTLRIRKRSTHWFPSNETGHFPQPLKIDPNEESGSSMKENIGPEDDENTEINPHLCSDKRKCQDLAKEDENHPMAKVSITSHCLMRTQTKYT